MPRFWALIMLLMSASLGAAVLADDGVWTVGEQGFFRVTVTAQGQGTGTVELVDRARGVLRRFQAVPEAPGAEGGPVLVEAGTYLWRKNLPSGLTARIEVVPIPLPNPTPELADGQSVRTSLAPDQALAWTVTVTAERPSLSLAVRGRSVAGVYLWRDRIWDSQLSPVVRTLNLNPSRSLSDWQWDQAVPPGTYRVVVLGGQRREWQPESSQDPLTISRGGDFLPAGSLKQGTLDSDGYSRVLLGPGTRTVEALVEGSGVAALSLRGQGNTSLQNTSRPAKSVSYLQVKADGARWAVLEGAPGMAYRMRALPEASVNGTVIRSGTEGVLLSGTASLRDGDGYPVTGVAVQRPELSVAWVRALEMDPAHPVHLATNNEASSQVYVQVKVAGSYAVVENPAAGGMATYRWDLLDDLVAGRDRPQTAAGNGSVTLQAKVYLLTSTPTKRGRIEWAAVPAGLGQGLTASGLWSVPRTDLPAEWSAVLAVTTSRSTWTLQWAQREENLLPVSVLALPVNAASLPPVSLEAGQSLAFPVDLGRSAWSGWTASTPVRLNGTVLAPGSTVAPGRATVSLTAAVRTRWPWRIEALSDQLAPAPVPELSVGTTVWADWKSDQTRTFELRVLETGLYKIVTEGRLSMAVSVQSPLAPRLFQANQNTGSRNAAVWAFLNPGAYQVAVTALGGTAGRAGLSLKSDPDPIRRTLVPGAQARATVPSDKPLVVDAAVPRSGDYRLGEFGLGQRFLYRLEDGQGFPVAEPTGSGDRTVRLSAGTVRLWSFPQPQVSRRAYSLEAGTPPSFGPLPASDADLIWGRTVQGEWLETPDRTPQTFRIRTSAPIRAQIQVSEGMVWTVSGESGPVLAAGQGGDPAEVDLPKGKITIGVRSRAVDSHKAFSLKIVTRDLTPGRMIRVPDLQEQVPLVVETEGTYEIGTWGPRELPLVLYPENGSTPLAVGTPKTDDWNPTIFVSLKPGRYRVAFQAPRWSPEAPTPASDEGEDRIESDQGDDEGDEDLPVRADLGAVHQSPWSSWTEVSNLAEGSGGGSVLRFTARPHQTVGAASTGVSPAEVWGAAVTERSFTPTEAGVYRFSSSGGRLVLFRLERAGTLLAQAPGGFEIPLRPGVPYRLLTWWEDANDEPVRCSIDRSSGVKTVETPRTSVRIPGTVWASAAWETPLTEAPGGWVTPREQTGWWRSDRADAQPQPVTLGAGQSASVPVGPEGLTVNLAVGPGEVGLLTASSPGLEVGASVQSGPPGPGWDWGQALFADGTTVVGVGPGAGSARVWLPETSTALRAVDLQWRTFPTVEAPSPAGGLLAPGQAALIRTKAAALQVVLDRGLACFAVEASGTRPVWSRDESVGTVPGKLWAVVNPGTEPRLWRAAAAAALPALTVTETSAWERRFATAGDADLEIRGAPEGQTFVLFEGTGSVRFGDGTGGRWLASRSQEGSGLAVRVFPSSRGLLQLRDLRGSVRVWTGSPKVPGPGPGLVAPVRGPLPPEGTSLPASGAQWTWTVPTAGFYSLSADGPGLLAVVDKDGSVAGGHWSLENRLVLVRLEPGPVTVTARPFDQEAQAGRLTLRALAPQPGPTAVLAPLEQQLWPVVVTAAGRVGLGVEAAAEGMELVLFDPSLRTMGRGALFWRALNPGTYWVVVQGAVRPVAYRPVFLGLEGSRTGIPDDVLAQYNQGTAP